MKLKSILKKAALAAAISSACVASSAAVADLGVLPIGTTSFNNAAFPSMSPTFADMIKFVLPANGGSTYGVIDFPLDLSAITPGLKFGTIFSAVSVNGAGLDGVVGTLDDVIFAGGIVTPNAPTFQFSLPANGGGAGYLFVSGLAPLGTAGSLYNGSITIAAVTPVPEPESYAMLLAGLGVMGAIAVRRKSKKQD